MQAFKIISALLLSALFVNAQPNLEWERSYDVSKDDRGVRVLTDHFGNIVVCGNDYYPLPARSFVILKYTSNGDILWTQRYYGSGYLGAQCYDMVLDDSGNVYITGIDSKSHTDCDIVTLKYDRNGNLKWEKVYNGPNSIIDVPFSISIDSNANIFVTGKSEVSSRDYKVVTMGYDNEGYEILNISITAASYSKNCMSRIDGKGNIFITYYNYINSTSEATHLAKYDFSGILKWNRIYSINNSLSNLVTAFIVKENGTTYLTGVTNTGITTLNIFFIKYDSSGNLICSREYPISDYCNTSNCLMEVENTGEVFLVGNCSNNSGYLLLKLNQNGDTLWKKIYRENIDYYYSRTRSLTDSFSNLYVIGSKGQLYAPWEIFTSKFDRNGNFVWATTYNNNFHFSQTAFNLTLDQNLNVYVVGHGYKSVDDQDILLLKYSQPIGIQNISSESPEMYSLSQNYPNPFNPQTKIRFDVPKASFTKLLIYDLLGREVATLVNEELKPGTYEADWDASNFPSGVYFYKIVAGVFTETKKMVLMK